MNENKTGSVKANYIYNTAFQILLLIIPIITTPYVSRVLGVNNIGIYSYGSAMVAYFVVAATFGSTTFGQREIAYHREDKIEMSRVFWDIFSFRVLTSIVAMIFYGLYLRVSGRTTFTDAMFAINIINVAADVTWFFQGIEKFKQIVLRNFIIKAISTICIFVFIKNESQLWLYVAIIFGSTLLGNISLWTLLAHKISLPRQINPFSGVKGMGLIFLPTIATQVYVILDKSMIGWITGSTYANGCYEQSEKIARMALTVVTSVGAVILPKVANLYHNKQIDRAKDYIYTSYRFVWLLALPIMVGLLTTSSVLVPVFLGNGYDDSIILLQIFSLLVIFVSLSYVTGLSYLIPTEQQNVYTVAVSCAAVLNLLLNLILIKKYSAYGAAIASVSAELVGWLIQIIYCCQTKQLQFARIWHPIWKYLASSIVMGGVICIIKSHIGINLMALITLVISGIIIYGAMLLILRDDFTLNNLVKVKNVIQRKVKG